MASAPAWEPPLNLWLLQLFFPQEMPQNAAAAAACVVYVLHPLTHLSNDRSCLEIMPAHCPHHQPHTRLPRLLRECRAALMPQPPHCSCAAGACCCGEAPLPRPPQLRSPRIRMRSGSGVPGVASRPPHLLGSARIDVLCGKTLRQYMAWMPLSVPVCRLSGRALS